MKEIELSVKEQAIEAMKNFMVDADAGYMVDLDNVREIIKENSADIGFLRLMVMTCAAEIEILRGKAVNNQQLSAEQQIRLKVLERFGNTPDELKHYSEWVITGSYPRKQG